MLEKVDTKLDQRLAPTRRQLPFSGVVLVLQGGGALGAYQAGVFQALHEASIEISWVCGTSIGAVNGALILGNPPERRIERLREFWETITTPQVDLPWIPGWFVASNLYTNYWANKISILRAMLQGAPGFFSARPFPPVNAPVTDPSDVSYYDISPLRGTLEKLAISNLSTLI
jgi:NTE family protein